MIRHAAFLLAALLSFVPAAAQVPASPPAQDVQVALDTNAGRIIIAVHVAKAPVTARNFLRYVDQKRLDGTGFYRAVGTTDYGFVQGGTQNDPARVLPPIAHEPTTQTGLTHDDGALSMARYAPGSATGDFFIVLGKMPSMDAQPASPGDNQGFAVFAHVVEGMEAVRSILSTPKSPTAGEGVMKGQMLEQPVRIVTARRLP
ncbi:peptidylprolyl isomerase [Sphingomonadales bacterium 56]|uniref:peptidylprolyl isomerase n=1 Tax=unclassified Sphingobium TaxID=2611147 RepID=UPI001918C9EF|nr:MULTISPECIES: peptidylprolyl isomerase [unclassified Sphingobium]MBY2928746.1 peptidylprolyl isomerase [Sphingomonadales bacterium 56]MBY2959405.1 peptidylprolyl isomerase [Sphingomonadales bacterium 58]CAD7337939.1 Peptidyl-prolyl cis-trans isomerase cyp18 [Sphingobium sp. S6]CAD7338887.1 Peptidyl-prolyl cis-trans isomerase cyp18 [Sphingobium sp. S8]